MNAAPKSMAGADGAGRISVVRDQRMVPLLSSTHGHAAVDQPWKGVLLEHHVVSRSEIPQHEHPDLCLHLQTTGAGDFEWWSEGRNAIEHTRPGSLILLPAGTTDRLRWSDRSERLILSVRQERLLELAGSFEKSGTPSFEANWQFTDPSLHHLVAEMGREAQREWPLGGLYADLLALGLATQLLRGHAHDRLEAPPWRGGLSLPKLRRAMEFMNAHLADDLRLEVIAQQLDLSASHFAHEFRNSTGQTPYQYLLDQRIAKAKSLLQKTVWPVQYISGVTGFGSPVNFVRAFRQRVGRSPAAWRKSA